MMQRDVLPPQQLATPKSNPPSSLSTSSLTPRLAFLPPYPHSHAVGGWTEDNVPPPSRLPPSSQAPSPPPPPSPRLPPPRPPFAHTKPRARAPAHLLLGILGIRASSSPSSKENPGPGSSIEGARTPGTCQARSRGPSTPGERDGGRCFGRPTPTRPAHFVYAVVVFLLLGRQKESRTGGRGRRGGAGGKTGWRRTSQDSYKGSSRSR